MSSTVLAQLFSPARGKNLNHRDFHNEELWRLKLPQVTGGEQVPSTQTASRFLPVFVIWTLRQLCPGIREELMQGLHSEVLLISHIGTKKGISGGFHKRSGEVTYSEPLYISVAPIGSHAHPDPIPGSRKSDDENQLCLRKGSYPQNPGMFSKKK